MTAFPPLPIVRAGAEKLTLRIDPRADEQLRSYADLLLRKGSLAGVTSVTGLEGIQRRHLLEGLAFFDFLCRNGHLAADSRVRIADVGSGGGLPGIPLAVLAPGATVVLIEATGRKAAFLREAVERLQLGEVSIVARRAEDLGHDPAYRGRFDLAVSRAVASLPALIELSLPLLREGGVMCAIKGSSVDEEVVRSARALHLCGGGPATVEPLAVPGGEERLAVVTVRKVAPTRGPYPRRPGMPAKRPL